MEWETIVAQNRLEAMVQDAPKDEGSSPSWNYINHLRVLELSQKFNIHFNRKRLEQLKFVGAVDQDGMPQKLETPAMEQLLWTLYDYLPFTCRFSVKALYTENVDKLVEHLRPIALDQIWTRKATELLLRPGMTIFSNRGFYFKVTNKQKAKRIENILCYAQKMKVRMELNVSTFDMFGSSSWGESFRGLRTAAVFALVKSIEKKPDETVIYCTPIAMGVAFRRVLSKAPQVRFKRNDEYEYENVFEDTLDHSENDEDGGLSEPFADK